MYQSIDIMQTPKSKETIRRTGTTERLKFITGSTSAAALAAKLDMIADKTIENRASIGFAYNNPDRLLTLNGLK